MTIAIKVTNRCDDVRFLKNMDFEIYINGESDDTLYRMEDGNPKFRKLFSIGKKTWICYKRKSKTGSTGTCRQHFQYKYAFCNGNN